MLKTGWLKNAFWNPVFKRVPKGCPLKAFHDTLWIKTDIGTLRTIFTVSLKAFHDTLWIAAIGPPAFRFGHVKASFAATLTSGAVRLGNALSFWSEAIESIKVPRYTVDSAPLAQLLGGSVMCKRACPQHSPWGAVRLYHSNNAIDPST